MRGRHWAGAICWLLAGVARASDPFADIAATPLSVPQPGGSNALLRFTSDNFTFKKELLSQFTFSGGSGSTSIYSRQSIGAEALKKFSTRTETVAAVDAQIRLVQRDHYLPVMNDMEGVDRKGLFLEFHNLYADFYNCFDPSGQNVGRYNLRLGRFYLPFGLNQQTDTHGTILQLSNDRNFGFERDWMAGLWGAVTPDINYDLYYLLGSGYNLEWEGQSGLAVSRLSLGPRIFNECGVEGGVSVMGGQRLGGDMMMPDEEARVIDTLRYGVDGRYTRMAPGGRAAMTGELSTGADDHDAVLSQLYGVDYLHHSRRWGAAGQYRDYRKEQADMGGPDWAADRSVAVEATWYFRNDIGNSTLHWVKANVERQVERMEGGEATLYTLQYYRYW
jgi:hypothetical protein